MNDKNQDEKQENMSTKPILLRSAKECAFAAVFVAILIASQFVLSALPGVEVITVLFCAYSFVFGVKRGVISAIAFSLVRQLIFGFFPSVLILYLIYYPLLTLAFGSLCKAIKANVKTIVFIVAISCVCCAAFSLLDCVITPLWYGYSAKAAKGYFLASLPVMGVQTVCVGLETGLLFLPLERVFRLIKRTFL